MKKLSQSSFQELKAKVKEIQGANQLTKNFWMNVNVGIKNKIFRDN